MTTNNHTPYPIGFAATADNANAPLSQLDDAIRKHNRTATSDPGVGNDTSQGFKPGSTWINTATNTIFICVDNTLGAAVWRKAIQTTDADDLTSGTVDLNVGGTGSNLSASGPGFLTQAGSGTPVATRLIVESDLPVIPATKIGSGDVDDTEFSYLNGVSSAIQTQIDTKASDTHKNTHAVGGSDAFAVTDLLDAIARSDITVNGATAGKRRKINFINTAGSSWSATDDPAQEAVNISIAGSGIGSDELTKVGASGTPDYLADSDFEQGVFHIRIKLSTRLKAWAESIAYEVLSSTIDSDGVVSTATVIWPDGSTGTFTRTTKNATWLAIDGYTISHDSSGQTVTQTSVTRDSNGQVITKPALTIT